MERRRPLPRNRRPATEPPDLGSLLRQLRLQANLTLADVGQRCGVTGSYIGHIELGRVRLPSHRILRDLAAVYGIDYFDLLRRAGHRVPNVRSASLQRYGWIVSAIPEAASLNERQLSELDLLFRAMVTARVNQGF